MRTAKDNSKRVSEDGEGILTHPQRNCFPKNSFDNIFEVLSIYSNAKTTLYIAQTTLEERSFAEYM